MNSVKTVDICYDGTHLHMFLWLQRINIVTLVMYQNIPRPND